MNKAFLELDGARRLRLCILITAGIAFALHQLASTTPIAGFEHCALALAVTLFTAYLQLKIWRRV